MINTKYNFINMFKITRTIRTISENGYVKSKIKQAIRKFQLRLSTRFYYRNFYDKYYNNQNYIK